MKPTKRIFTVALCIFVFSTLGIIGCSNQMAKSIRSVTYPPDFKYIEPDELRSEMGKLAQELRLLDLALDPLPDPAESQELTEIQRQKILIILGNIERIASSLQATETGSSHPFMQDYMSDFVRRVGEARIAASLPRPRYYFAGQVAGGCTNCHQVYR